MEESTTQKCPFCLGDVPLAAQKCKHCGEWLPKKAIETTQVDSIGPVGDDKVQDSIGPSINNSTDHVVEPNLGTGGWEKNKFITRILIPAVCTILIFIIYNATNSTIKIDGYNFNFGTTMAQIESEYPLAHRKKAWNLRDVGGWKPIFPGDELKQHSKCSYYIIDRNVNFLNDKYLLIYKIEEDSGLGLAEVGLYLNKLPISKYDYLSIREKLIKKLGKSVKEDMQYIDVDVMDCESVWNVKNMKITLTLNRGMTKHQVSVVFSSNNSLDCHPIYNMFDIQNK